MPTYNQPDYLRYVLDSIVSQDFKDYEVIISDDSTDDESGKLVEQYRSKIPHLTYFRNIPSKKSPMSWNEAIKHAEGEYIKVQHSDDWFSFPSALGKFVAMLDEHPGSDFAFSAARVCGPDKKIKFVHSCTNGQLQSLKKSPSYLFGRNIVGAPSATIYRSSITHKYYDEKMKWVVDLDQYISILQDNPNFVYCDRPLVSTTDGATHQSIHESVGRVDVEVYEWMLLYAKLRKKYENIPYRFYILLYIMYVLYHCRVSSMDQIQNLNLESEEKNLIGRLLKFRFIFIAFAIRKYIVKIKYKLFK